MPNLHFTEQILPGVRKDHMDGIKLAGSWLLMATVALLAAGFSVARAAGPRCPVCDTMTVMDHSKAECWRCGTSFGLDRNGKCVLPRNRMIEE